MLTFLTRPYQLWIISLFCAVTAHGADSYGGIKGTLALPQSSKGLRIAVEKYTGKISGKVNPAPVPVAGVWLTRQGLRAQASPPPLRLSQKGYQFSKSLLIIPLNTTVFFPNEDPDYHNVFSLSRKNRFDLGRYQKGETPEPSRLFSKEGFIRLRCEIHEHMRATIIVVDSPYVATTNESGHFTFKNIPPGTYTLHAQFNKKVKYKTTVTVTSGNTTIIPTLAKS